MKITQIVIVTLTAISFMACGNGSSKTTTPVEEDSNETTNETIFEKIAIDVNCTSPDTVSEYITLKSGDQIVKEAEDSNISILEDENGVKTVCLQSGKLYIKRAVVE